MEYVNSKTKVTIICPIHGEFEQISRSHMEGSKCPKCSRMTLETFIKKCKKVHGDKYDYSETTYINTKTKVKIICKKHGIFEQTSKSHLKGNGCPKCSFKFGLTKEIFIERSKKVHGDKYDYSLVEYKNVTSKVKIICPKHGEFEQVVDSHINGINCPKCGLENRSEKRRMTIEEFVKKSNKIHKNKYDYSLVKYKNNLTKIKIICPKHGIFEQIPSSHLNGHECSECTNNGSIEQKYLYIFYDKEYNLYKIGISSNPQRRFKSIIDIKTRTNTSIFNIYENSGKHEYHLHKKYEQFRTEHTLYKDGKTEWFSLNENHLKEIDKFLKSQK